MTSSEVWDEQTAAAYDTAVASEFAPEVLSPAVDYLQQLAHGRPVLEFAIGTGRVGIPLMQRGLAVTGVDLSRHMVAQLRRKVDDRTLPVVVGDMATVRIDGTFSLVLLVFNSISNLRTQEEQVACFLNAARHLRPGGRFAIELWVPDLQQLVAGSDTSATCGPPSATSWPPWPAWCWRPACRTGRAHHSRRRAVSTSRGGASIRARRSRCPGASPGQR